jgi:hypothetical protein
LRSDDELLSHIRAEAGVRRHRRQRAMVGAAAAAVVLLLGAGALAASVSDDDQSVMTQEGETTTTVEETTTTEEPTSTTEGETTTTTTTTVPTETTTSTTEAAPPTTTAPPPTTTQPPIEPVTATNTHENITLTVTATQDRARPGEVALSIRIQSDNSSGPTGYTMWGDGTPMDGYSWFEDDVWLDCPPEEDPDNPGEYLPYEPDPNPGPVDETFTQTHTYGGDPGTVEITVSAIVGYCYEGGDSVTVNLAVPIGG